METLEPATAPTPKFSANYAIVEIMGHRRYGARVSEVQCYGGTFLLAEVLSDPPFEQLVSPSSIFAITPCTEEQARRACSSWIVPSEIRPPVEHLALPEHASTERSYPTSQEDDDEFWDATSDERRDDETADVTIEDPSEYSADDHQVLGGEG